MYYIFFFVQRKESYGLFVRYWKISGSLKRKIHPTLVCEPKTRKFSTGGIDKKNEENHKVISDPSTNTHRSCALQQNGGRYDIHWYVKQ